MEAMLTKYRNHFEKVKTVKLRLIYTGPLNSSQPPHPANGKEKHIQHKHEIRKEFHKQLKRFWETNLFLSTAKVSPSEYGVDIDSTDLTTIWGPDVNGDISLSKAVANSHQELGYKFVPLVRKNWKLVGNLKILLLRQDGIVSSYSAGDLDNRLKTIIDALTKPSTLRQLEYNEKPAEGEGPFYCLFEDDRLVGSIEVETDSLLTPLNSSQPEALSHVHVVVSAEIKPHNVDIFNLSFAT
jgi:hypothetical protein